MESKVNYTIVGIVVLVLAAGLLSTALWLSVGFHQKEYDHYTVYLHEAATGLSEKAPVKFNGVQVGFVQTIKLSKNDPRQVEIILSIEQGTPITTSTTATLISQGITGVSYLGLSAGSADLTPLQKMRGEPYPVIPAKPSLFNQIDTAIKEVSESVHELSNQAQLFFSKENAEYLNHTLKSIQTISGVMADNGKQINRSLKNMDVFLDNMSTVSKEFPQIVGELKSGVKKFNSLADELRITGKSVSSTMVSGKNTMDKISQETIPNVTVLLRRLNAISANLDKVSEEMRQNPSVIIRGTSAPKPGPGE